MPRVLVTGGTGGLGRELVPRLMHAGYTVRVMSRRPTGVLRDERKPGEFPEAGWAQTDLETGQGLGEALAEWTPATDRARAPAVCTRPHWPAIPIC